jgi:subtilisin family serine protease
VNSAGNEGIDPNFPDRNTLGAPADADSVLAVGAVQTTGTRASFSSVGPTTSVPPRIKPDVMAQGVSVVVASYTDPLAYGTSAGTSYACPLAAGVAALALHAKPTASPMEIVNALKSTASRAGTPDNEYGWGIVNAQAAISLLTGVAPPEPRLPAHFALRPNYPNPFNPSTAIPFDLAASAHVRLTVTDLLGRSVRTLLDADLPASHQTAFWDGRDAAGRRLAAGMYFCTLHATAAGAGTFVETRRMILLP